MNSPGAGAYDPSYRPAQPASPGWKVGSAKRRPLSATNNNPGPGMYKPKLGIGGPKVSQFYHSMGWLGESIIIMMKRCLVQELIAQQLSKYISQTPTMEWVPRVESLRTSLLREMFQVQEHMIKKHDQRQLPHRLVLALRKDRQQSQIAHQVLDNTRSQWKLLTCPSI